MTCTTHLGLSISLSMFELRETGDSQSLYGQSKKTVVFFCLFFPLFFSPLRVTFSFFFLGPGPPTFSPIFSQVPYNILFCHFQIPHIWTPRVVLTGKCACRHRFERKSLKERIWPEGGCPAGGSNMLPRACWQSSGCVLNLLQPSWSLHCVICPIWQTHLGRTATWKTDRHTRTHTNTHAHAHTHTQYMNIICIFILHVHVHIVHHIHIYTYIYINT